MESTAEGFSYYVLVASVVDAHIALQVLAVDEVLDPLPADKKQRGGNTRSMAAQRSSA